MFLLLVVILAALCTYWYSVKNFQYWKKRGVKHDTPVPFFGNTLRQILRQLSIAEFVSEMYHKYPTEKYVGMYMGNNPVLILRDPAIIQQIMATDFHYFYPRGVLLHKEVYDPLMKNLFTIDGDTWKLLRQRITPAFTSAKLKAMFPLIVERAEKLQTIAEDFAEKGKEIDVRELMARYTTDFIGACGFGVEADTLNDENSIFRKLGKRIFHISPRDAIVLILKALGPETFKKWNYFAPEIQTNTFELVESIMKQRNYKPCGRNDFIDLLLELKQKGKIVGESVEKRNPDGTPEIVELEMDDMLMAAQAFIFFAAGFETSSTSTSHALHQLAFHKDLQEKCQNEIDEVLGKYGGRLCYDAVKEMKFLEMVFKESLRVLPPVGFLTRRCARKYTIPATNLVIDEDVWIVIPVDGLHHDPQYFEEPEKFYPERFDPKNVESIKKYTYLPFGEGPRACIGERLGIMQSTAGLAAVLSRYTVVPSQSTVKELKIDPTSTIAQKVLGGVPLQLVARKKLK
ncbi:cytochrome p450 domain-containing protein [Phthorimaea operculella]|nr:cytochrome p450 domain-containing protein [Phthorimaea operculella]